MRETCGYWQEEHSQEQPPEPMPEAAACPAHSQHGTEAGFDFSQGRAAEEERSWTVLTVKIRAGQGEKSGQGPGKDKTTLVNGFWSSDSSSGGIRVINEWTL